MAAAVAAAITAAKLPHYEEARSDHESSMAESESDIEVEKDPSFIDAEVANSSRAVPSPMGSPEESLNEVDEVDEEKEAEETSEAVEEDDDEDEDDEGEASADDDDSAESGESDIDSVTSEAVGAVKVPNLDGAVDSAQSDTTTEESDSVAVGEGSSDEDSSGQGSEAEAEWEATSDAADEAEAEAVDPNSCIFCKQDEMHDPAEVFEELLACTVCGDHAHQKCARDAGSLNFDDDAKAWRCPDCVENMLEPDAASNGAQGEAETNLITVLKNPAGAPKLIRDLLPAVRGVIKPDSHSIFNEIVLEGDALDGSRSLRKRKLSTDNNEERIATDMKRRKKSVSQPASTSASRIKREAQGIGETAELDIEDDMTERITQRKRIRPPRNATRTIAKSNLPFATITHTTTRAGGKEIRVTIRADNRKVSKILNARPHPAQPMLPVPKRDRKKRPKPPPIPEETPEHFPPLLSGNYVSPLFPADDRESNEIFNKPYGGILGEADADTSRSLPTSVERQSFERARKSGEELFRQNLAAHTGNGDTIPRPTTRVSGPPSRMKCISFGPWEIDTNYAAPYPEEYNRNEKLFICEFCLKYMASEHQAWRHKLKCPDKHPPGDEIYRDGTISIFEVDGRKRPVYCQNLCLLAKLFLGSKTLYYDVEPFLFYVMAEYDHLGYHFVGYFSKEKRPSSLNNVSCILTLPVHQRKGYGNLLIDFSYLLTRIEGKEGSPEKPLSDMGLIAYRNYWELALSYQLRNVRPHTSLSFKTLSARTGMTTDDIIAGLEHLRVLVRDPGSGKYAFRMDYDYFNEAADKWELKGYVTLNPECLVWTPYELAPSQLEHAPMHTMAPRQEEDRSESEITKAREETIAKEGLDTDSVTCEVLNMATQDAKDKSPTEDERKQNMLLITNATFVVADSLNDASEPNSPSKQLNGDMDSAMATTNPILVPAEADARHARSESRSHEPELAIHTPNGVNGLFTTGGSSDVEINNGASHSSAPDLNAGIPDEYTGIEPRAFELWPPVPSSAVKNTKKRNRSTAFLKPGAPASAVRTSGRTTPRRAAAVAVAVAQVSSYPPSTPTNGSGGAITAARVGSALRRATRSSRLNEEIVVGGLDGTNDAPEDDEAEAGPEVEMEEEED